MKLTVGLVAAATAVIVGVGAWNLTRPGSGEDNTTAAGEPVWVGEDLVAATPAAPATTDDTRRKWETGLQVARESLHQLGVVMYDHEPGDVNQPDRFNRITPTDIRGVTELALKNGWHATRVGCAPVPACPPVARVHATAGNTGAHNTSSNPEWDLMDPSEQTRVALTVAGLPATAKPVINLVRPLRADMWMYTGDNPDGRWTATVWPASGPVDGDTRGS